MKKMIACLLALVMAVSCMGCGGDEGDPTIPTPPASGETPIVYKSYTVSDEEAAAARDRVVGSVYGKDLTSGLLQVYYWMGIYTFMNSGYGTYPELYGLDYTLPLDQQGPAQMEQSWQEYFLEDAISTWHVYQVLSAALEAEGLSLPDELEKALDERIAQLEESAKKEGFDTLDELIQSDAGAGCTLEDYMRYTRTYYEYKYYIQLLVERAEVTDEALQKYYQDNKDALNEEGITKDSGDVISLRHILIVPEGGTEKDGKTVYTDAEWEACRVKAQALLDQWVADGATEEAFDRLAREKSDDPGSADEGGLYEGLDKDTEFVEPFKNWYLEAGRQAGDYGLVKTDYGYHLMYFSGYEPEWEYHCRNGVINDTVTAQIEQLKTDHPYEVDFDKVVLGEVVLVATS